jgi:hypothetical protein
MADEFDNFALNILGVQDLVESNTNKVTAGAYEPEGKVGNELEELELPMSDKALLKLRNQWEVEYAPYEGKIKEIPKRNLRSYLGLDENGQFPSNEAIAAANLQFESEETFLPAATAQDPSPFVFSDGSPEGNKLADDIQTVLEFQAQQLLLRRKLAQMVRQWSVHHLGGLKIGWKKFRVNGREFGDVAVENRKIQDFIFDPNGYVDVYGDFSSWMGERIYVTAKKLIELFPNKKEDILAELLLTKKNLGTEVCYTEWWNDDYCFSTMQDIVLDKHKNEFFNYAKKIEGDFEDEDGNPVMEKVHNHFSIPKKPYVFLSVFSLGDRPHDLTGLIEQNIPNQNRINRREQQLDGALGQAVNGTAFSENNFNQETAKQAANALKDQNKGQILIPAGGDIEKAIYRIPAPEVKEGFFKDLENTQNSMRSSWGTQGIASQQQKPDETARGMILNQGRDTSRIGGGIVDVLEQSVAKSVFDWIVQVICVFYDEPHFAAVLGQGKAVEYVQIEASNINRPLIIGVAPNSMRPKDQISKMNQATQLFEMKAIGPKTLLEMMDFPNADEAAGDGVLYALDPQAYLTLNFPELAQKLQQLQAQAQQAQAQAQQQQMQMEAQGVQQKQQMEAQGGQQKLAQSEAEHQMKLKQAEEQHQMKLKQASESASAKLASQTAGAMPK